MKIYTGTGDSGKTSLFSGERLSKNDIRVATYGTVDELNSFVGAVAADLPEGAEKKEIAHSLALIQGDLFVIGGLLATSPDSRDVDMLPVLTRERTVWLESTIDTLQEALPELRSFILPGGHPSAAMAHCVRTICRRTEREVLTLAELTSVADYEEILRYLNRLSDYFFVLARFLNKMAGIEERSWHG